MNKWKRIFCYITCIVFIIYLIYFRFNDPDFINLKLKARIAFMLSGFSLFLNAIYLNKKENERYITLIPVIFGLLYLLIS